MDAINCPRCGRMFTKVSANICKDCEKAEVEKFEEVRLYVKENPNSSAQEVSEKCEVSVKRILQYVRDGKLEISQGMEGLITCSKCGRPIKSGRMCERCTKNIAGALTNMISVGNAAKEKEASSSGPKQSGMYTLNKN
ncbi:MAG: flagellar protein [Defluviitaleaceae bacterium]|nr:flagellar protein [Defluviitaleaceae bacterium]